MTDPWAQPAKPGDAVYPALKQLQGRLLVIEPKQLEENVPDTYNQGKTKDRITADVTFLDGDTLTVSVDKDDRATPLPKPIGPGETIPSMYISQTVLVNQIKKELPGVGRGMVLGRLIKGEARGGNNAPWLIDQYTEADAEVARRWYTWRQNQQAQAAIPSPQPQQQPQQAQPQYQPPAPQQQPQYAPQPQQQAPQQPMYAPGGDSQPQQQAWGQQQAPQAPQQPQQQFAPQVGGPNIDPAPNF